MKFEEKLIKLRKEKGLSQEELGYKINVSRQAISKWESGQAQPEIEKVKEMSKFFGVSTDYLLKDEIEEKEPKPKKQKSKKKILKVVLLILSVILVLYLITVIYKLSILMMCAKKVEQIEDYEEYEIYSIGIMNDKLTNEIIKQQGNIIYKNGVSYSEYYTNSKIVETENSVYTEYSSSLNNIPDNIEYKNLNEKISYNLLYNSELGKYVYHNWEDDYFETEEEKEEIYKTTTIKDISQQYISNDVSLFIMALNPGVKLKLDEGFIYIQENFKGGYQNITIDRQTGFFSDVLFVNEMMMMSMSCSYMIEEVDDSEVQEPNVDYIILEETEE